MSAKMRNTESRFAQMTLNWLCFQLYVFALGPCMYEWVVFSLLKECHIEEDGVLR